MTLRTRIEAILDSVFENKPMPANAVDQILSLISEHYVEKEKVREEIEKFEKTGWDLDEFFRALLYEDRAISK